MVDILLSYDFLVVALGTGVLAMVSAIVGCFSVYRGQSLVGDAMGHSTFPGIVLAFMVFQSRNPILLWCGAMISAGLAYYMVQLIIRRSTLRMDAVLAMVLSGFFGLGLVLKTYIQGNPLYERASQAGLKNYIFGLAAFLMKQDVVLIVVVSLICLGLIWLFYKELVLVTFDSEFSKSLGIPIWFIDLVLLVMTISLISLGIKNVGAILISSFLVIPCLCARQWSHSLKSIFMVSCGMAFVSSFLGTYVSSLASGLSTGPMIIITMAILTLISMKIGKYGCFQRRRRT